MLPPTPVPRWLLVARHPVLDGVKMKMKRSCSAAPFLENTGTPETGWRLSANVKQLTQVFTIISSEVCHSCHSSGNIMYLSS